MKSMNVIILLLLSALTLSSCGNNKSTAEFCNYDTACILGNTFYQSVGEYICWNPAWNEIRSGLCFDPLCDHKDTESLCPDNTWLWQKTIITDGKKLYLSVLNSALTDRNNTMYRRFIR